MMVGFWPLLSSMVLPSAALTFRPATSSDTEALWGFLQMAAEEPSREAVTANPTLVAYVHGFGERPGDCGVVADDQNGRLVGAAWCRLWSDRHRGYCFIDDATPEMALAVDPDHRGQGIGTQLVQHLLETLAEDYPAVCLGVRTNNPAWQLYQRMGFYEVEGSRVTNRVGGTSLTMIYRFTKD